MQVLLVVTALIALASVECTFQEDQEFQDWKQKFGKVYTSVEDEAQHKKYWLENKELVVENNKLAEKSYRLGMTYYADMGMQEYKELTAKGCLSFDRTRKHSGERFLGQTGGAALPDTVDWRDKGYVTDIKDQKACGSCWAFSAAGALEGQTFRKTGKLVSLSVQQLVDCSKPFGCNGSSMINAFKYVNQNKGLDTDDSYPYEATNGSCRFNRATIGATCTGYVKITNEDEIALQKAVATIGPISAAIDTSVDNFRLYESGVYDEPACSSTDLDHGVLVVGYGTENGKDYWLVKNSWGLGWGEKGYIKMSRNKNNQCGIATFASYPLVSSKTQRVQCETYATVFVLGCFLLGMFY